MMIPPFLFPVVPAARFADGGGGSIGTDVEAFLVPIEPHTEPLRSDVRHGEEAASPGTSRRWRLCRDGRASGRQLRTRVAPHARGRKRARCRSFGGHAGGRRAPPAV